MFISQKSKSFPASIPAPVGGWNARDALGEMEQTDAVVLENWFPSTSTVNQRNGYTKFSTGITGQVETVMAYSGGVLNKFFAAAVSKIHDISAGGAVGAAVVSGLTNARFQYINTATSGGNFLLAVNGADKLRGYDGTAWWIDGDGSHDITGVNTNTIIGINLFKNRVWMVQKDTLNVWYLPTSAIAGAATSFPLQGIAKEGGYVMAMGTWTIDSGYGLDDMAAFVTSKGEVIVYRGTDPSSSTTWSLVGVFRLGAPIGRRCFLKYAGDLLLISQDGLVPMASAIQSSRLDPRVSLTNKIQYATSSAISNYGGNYGWQAINFPKQNMLFLNVPVNEGSHQQQYVMNTITQSWCNFTGWDANCWELFQDNIYFGGNGFVGKAWDGFSDNGNAITTNGRQAFNYFKNPGILKRWTMIRPIFFSSATPYFSSNVLCSINVDFDDVNQNSPISFSSSSYGVWNTALWDVDIWGGDLLINKNWQGVTGIGYCCSIVLKSAAIGLQIQWVSTDIVMERGGIL